VSSASHYALGHPITDSSVSNLFGNGEPDAFYPERKWSGRYILIGIGKALDFSKGLNLYTVTLLDAEDGEVTLRFDDEAAERTIITPYRRLAMHYTPWALDRAPKPKL
jgi:hypothetical protein